MLALVSGSESSDFDRWTVLAPRLDSRRIKARVGDPGELLRSIREFAPPRPATFVDGGRVRLPFVGGWIGFLGYECASAFEPRAARGSAQSTDWPDAILCRVPRALVYSHELRRWFEVGDSDAAEVAPLVACDQGAPLEWIAEDGGSLRPKLDTADFKRMVTQTVGYIGAGDIFQANITQPFNASIVGSSRQFALDALATATPRYGAYLELDDDHAILSFSPELFLSLDGASRRVTTRPMKGTRPDRADAAELMASAKDAAELHMIVDLMRNDLGRVCETGSVRVDRARELERHPTVLQTVAEVSGTLSQRRDLADLVQACFPPGSVTGAPKVRAMQIINEIESDPRGPYCGAIGLASGCGSATLSVAIRTARLTRNGDIDQDRWEIDYRAGCGIVAESDPAEEARECLAKTRIAQLALGSGASHQDPVAAPA